MNTSYKIALVGCGKVVRTETRDGFQIGYQHTLNLSQQTRGTMVAGVDINEVNLKAWQEKFGIEKGFLSYAEMLEEVKPDVVCISTYVGTHYPLIEQAARAGVKGIVCEKPFLNSPVEIEKLRALARETGVRVVVNHMRRYQPIFMLAKKLIKEGRIGPPEIMSAGIDGWDLSEWGAHWIDIFRYLNEDVPVKWVMGQVRARDLHSFGHKMEDHAIAYFGFENGCRGLLDGGFAIGASTISITGSEGSMRFLGEGHLIVQTKDGNEEFKTDSYTLDMWLGPWNALFDWIEGGMEPDLGLTNQLRTNEVNLGAYVSALIGDRVDLPLMSDLDIWPVDAIATKSAGK